MHTCCSYVVMVHVNCWRSWSAHRRPGRPRTSLTPRVVSTVVYLRTSRSVSCLGPSASAHGDRLFSCCRSNTPDGDLRKVHWCALRWLPICGPDSDTAGEAAERNGALSSSNSIASVLNSSRFNDIFFFIVTGAVPTMQMTLVAGSIKTNKTSYGSLRLERGLAVYACCTNIAIPLLGTLAQLSICIGSHGVHSIATFSLGSSLILCTSAPCLLGWSSGFPAAFIVLLIIDTRFTFASA